jgi:DNA transformation protein
VRLLEAQYTHTVLIMGKYDYPMPNNPAYLNFASDLLSPLGSIVARSMMGGHVLYCDSVVFALIANNTLYLKADAETRPRFEELGLKPFYPFEGQASMSYYQPPAEFFEAEDMMLEWGRMAVAAGRRSKTKKKRSRSARL